MIIQVIIQFLGNFLFQTIKYMPFFWLKLGSIDLIDERSRALFLIIFLFIIPNPNMSRYHQMSCKVLQSVLFKKCQNL